MNKKQKLHLPLTVTLGVIFLLECSSLRAGQPITPVALTGQLPPGIGPNTGYDLFQEFTGSPGLNEAGEIQFNAFLIGAGINSTNDTALFEGAPGALQFVAREGSPAPGLPNRTYAQFFTPSPLDRSGDIFLVTTWTMVVIHSLQACPERRR